MSARYRFRPYLGLAGALAAIALALGLPGVGRAACGGVETAHPAHHRRGQLAPLAIGDSTMLLSVPGLAARGYAVNAQGCRQFVQALGLLRRLKARGRLPHLVVIALGANGSVTRDEIGVALGLLCCTRRLALVTPRQVGGAPGENAIVEHAEARRHRGRILLLDWVRDSAGRSGWFQPDRLHLTPPGVAAFTRLLAGALPYAYPRAKARRATPKRLATELRPAQAAAGFALTATLGNTGYVDATITGTPGTSVQLSEQLAGSTTPIEVIQLPAAGAFTVVHALTWSCDQQVRTLLALTLPPAEPAAATSTVTTPSCSGRLAAAIDRRAPVGGVIAIRLRDRWGIGGLALTVCVTPPGGRRTCAPWQLRPGQTRRVLDISAPRPGGWRTAVRTSYGFKLSAVVWVSHPGGRIRLLAAGDSEMQILDGYLGQDLARYGVSVTSDARVSTGLTKPSIFSWPRHAARQAVTLRPDVTVFFIGANDGFPVAGPGGHSVDCCGAAWSSGYANLVAEMMRTYLRGNAGRVYWFLLPTPRPATFQALFNAVNAGILRAATRYRGRVSLINAGALFTPGNRYRDYMFYRGQGVVIHESDGIHLSAASDAIAASIVTARLLADRVIR